MNQIIKKYLILLICGTFILMVFILIAQIESIKQRMQYGIARQCAREKMIEPSIKHFMCDDRDQRIYKFIFSMTPDLNNPNSFYLLYLPLFSWNFRSSHSCITPCPFYQRDADLFAIRISIRNGTRLLSMCISKDKRGYPIAKTAPFPKHGYTRTLPMDKVLKIIAEEAFPSDTNAPLILHFRFLYNDVTTDDILHQYLRLYLGSFLSSSNLVVGSVIDPYTKKTTEIARHPIMLYARRILIVAEDFTLDPTQDHVLNQMVCNPSTPHTEQIVNRNTIINNFLKREHVIQEHFSGVVGVNVFIWNYHDLNLSASSDDDLRQAVLHNLSSFGAWTWVRPTSKATIAASDIPFNRLAKQIGVPCVMEPEFFTESPEIQIHQKSAFPDGFPVIIDFSNESPFRQLLELDMQSRKENISECPENISYTLNNLKCLDSSTIFAGDIFGKSLEGETLPGPGLV